MKATRTMRAWVVFYLDEDGTEYCTEAIGISKEQAYSRFQRLCPQCDFHAKCWVVRRVKMTWKAAK